jgi:hypothetical protein
LEQQLSIARIEHNPFTDKSLKMGQNIGKKISNKDAKAFDAKLVGKKYRIFSDGLQNYPKFPESARVVASPQKIEAPDEPKSAKKSKSLEPTLRKCEYVPKPTTIPNRIKDLISKNYQGRGSSNQVSPSLGPVPQDISLETFNIKKNAPNSTKGKNHLYLLTPERVFGPKPTFKKTVIGNSLDRDIGDGSKPQDSFFSKFINKYKKTKIGSEEPEHEDRSEDYRILSPSRNN